MRHLFSAVVVAVLGAPLVFAAADVNGVCKIIAAKVSNASAVFFPRASRKFLPPRTHPGGSDVRLCQGREPLGELF